MSTTTGSNLKLTTCTISDTSYTDAYIKAQITNPISNLEATTGTWYYYSINSICYKNASGEEVPIVVSPADTVTIKFEPSTLNAPSDVYTFIQSQGGKCGTDGEDYPYVSGSGGCAGGGGGGQIYSRYLTTKSETVTVKLFPTGNNSNSNYAYNGNTITVGSGGLGQNGGDGKPYQAGNGGNGGNGENDGSGGVDEYYFGGAGGNGGRGGYGPYNDAVPYPSGTDGSGGNGKKSGGGSGTDGQNGRYNYETPGSTIVKFKDNEIPFAVGYGGYGGPFATAGDPSNFMVYFSA